MMDLTFKANGLRALLLWACSFGIAGGVFAQAEEFNIMPDFHYADYGLEKATEGFKEIETYYQSDSKGNSKKLFSETNQYFFNSSGYLDSIVVRDDSGRVVEVQRVKYEGELPVEMGFFIKGKVYRSHHWEYDSGKLATYYQTNEKDKTILKVEFDYPESGPLKTESWVHKGIRTAFKEFYETYSLESSYNNLGELLSLVRRDLGESGNTIREWHKDAKGQLLHTKQFTYDDAGNLLHTQTQLPSGRISTATLFRYADGKCVEELVFVGDYDKESGVYLLPQEMANWTPSVTKNWDYAVSDDGGIIEIKALEQGHLKKVKTRYLK